MTSNELRSMWVKHRGEVQAALDGIPYRSRSILMYRSGIWPMTGDVKSGEYELGIWQTAKIMKMYWAFVLELEREALECVTMKLESRQLQLLH